MVRRLIEFSLDNPLLVCLFALAVMLCGGYAFMNVNVEAYPDPAPAIIEVVAQRNGWSAEEMERRVTTPIEVALAGMPGLTSTRSKSLFGQFPSSKFLRVISTLSASDLTTSLCVCNVSARAR